MRRLIKTFPGLPLGAGIYELEDGTQKFFNCVPNGPLPNPEDLVDFDYPYTVTDSKTGQISFNKEDPYYHRLKGGSEERRVGKECRARREASH